MGRINWMYVLEYGIKYISVIYMVVTLIAILFHDKISTKWKRISIISIYITGTIMVILVIAYEVMNK